MDQNQILFKFLISRIVELKKGYEKKNHEISLERLLTDTFETRQMKMKEKEIYIQFVNDLEKLLRLE